MKILQNTTKYYKIKKLIFLLSVSTIININATVLVHDVILNNPNLTNSLAPGTVAGSTVPAGWSAWSSTSPASNNTFNHNGSSVVDGFGRTINISGALPSGDNMGHTIVSTGTTTQGFFQEVTDNSFTLAEGMTIRFGAVVTSVDQFATSGFFLTIRNQANVQILNSAQTVGQGWTTVTQDYLVPASMDGVLIGDAIGIFGIRENDAGVTVVDSMFAQIILPEPSSALMIIAGLGLGLLRRHRR